MSLALSDQCSPVRGDFTLRVYRAGALVEEFVECNVIVNASKGILVHLIGGDVANRSITTIGFGSGTNAADPSNSSLTSPYQKGLDSVSYPADGASVLFAFSLQAAEANGMAIQEFGLFTAGGQLFARKVRATPINKDADLTFTGTWQISF